MGRLGLVWGLMFVTSAWTGCVGLPQGEQLDPQSTESDEDAQPSNASEGPPRTNASREAQNTTDSAPDEPANATDEPTDEDPLSVLSVTDAGRLEIEIPVHVALVGFQDGVAERLAERLEPELINQSVIDYPLPYPTGPDDEPRRDAKVTANPVQPIANYTVHDLPESFADDYENQLSRQGGAGGDEPIYDADAAERWLARELPEAGVPVEASTPTLVLLHAGEQGEHAYRYDYENGFLEPVRVFGGEEPLLVLDVSASPDPFLSRENCLYVPVGYVCHEPIPGCQRVSTSGVEECQFRDAYDRPVGAGGDETVDALEQAAHDATRFRLLHGPVYPPSTRECHAITLVVGVESTTLGANSEFVDGPDQLLAPERLQAAFDEVLGPAPVHVDTRVVELPAGDPPLWSAANSRDPNLVRAWVTENWEDYWVAHEGCEAYLSLHLFGDFQVGNWGIAMMDRSDGYRVSFSVTETTKRFRETYDGPASEHATENPSSRDGYDRVNALLSHETGHLLGFRHPHGADVDGSPAADWSFSSTVNVMSYQTEDRTVRFGTIDQANLQRNRAGFMVQQAVEAGHRDDERFREALLALAKYDWARANQRLQGLAGS